MSFSWKQVVGYEGRYEVSDLGLVRSVDRLDSIGRRRKGRLLNPFERPDGYLGVSLCNGTCRGAYVHRLVLEAFVGPCPDGMEARHFPDNDRSNNRLSNLSWGTHRENISDKAVHGTQGYGEKQGASKLTSTDVERIFELRRAGYTQQQIGNLFGVSQTNIHYILNGHRWAHALEV